MLILAGIEFRDFFTGKRNCRKSAENHILQRKNMIAGTKFTTLGQNRNTDRKQVKYTCISFLEVLVVLE